MSEPRWLDETQLQAWLGLLCLKNRGFPEIERTLKRHDLLVVHFTVLVSLSEATDRTLRLSYLAEIANVSQSRLTHRMRTLVDRDFVVIEADPDDRRAKNATLTDQGFRWLELAAPAHAEDVLRLIFDHLTPAETRAFATGLTKIADNLLHR